MLQRAIIKGQWSLGRGSLLIQNLGKSYYSIDARAKETVLRYAITVLFKDDYEGDRGEAGGIQIGWRTSSY
jgi:hypothetical protein